MIDAGCNGRQVARQGLDRGYRMRLRIYRLSAAALGAVILAALGPEMAGAQEKGPSDRSVQVLMNYAWTVLPNKFTTPQGKVIEVDKTKQKEIVVPIDVAREVVRVARLSAHAQICELGDEQVANYQTLMRRELAKKQWSEQQMLYINQLHLFTVMWLTGKVKLVEKDGDKEVVIEEGKAAKVETCTDEQRKKVSDTIKAYVMADAPKEMREGAAAPAAAAPAPKKK